MEIVLDFEHMLVRSGARLLNYYLDISRDEQNKRLKDRSKDPLKQWKVT
jgi:polyphosphate kinase 2 (PPK2 family)